MIWTCERDCNVTQAAKIAVTGLNDSRLVTTTLLMAIVFFFVSFFFFADYQSARVSHRQPNHIVRHCNGGG